MDRILRQKRYIFIFVGPALLLYVVFGLIPIIYNTYISLYKTNLLGKKVFVGFQNYINLFNDQFFTKAITNNLKFVLGSYIAHMVIAMLISYILFQKIKGAKLFQSIYFMPSVICGTAIGMLWSFIYHPNFGLVNSFLNAIGLEKYTRIWLANEHTVLPSLIVISMWQFVGYHIVIQLAGMKNIDGTLFEAAAIDGASKWQQFIKIIFPLMKKILMIDSVLIITGSLKLYDLVAVTTSGGPNHASEVMSTYMYYQGFRALKFGYSSAIGMILLLLCAGATLIIRLAFYTKDE
ncbi:sugar ABC transporter permease [Vallitalea pronyensis]|uniref:Sugar ABC transporter permease n=1 Tax=Vallitalea pronyensis TaxID=1348613 RepID=A0A8J8MMG6_9FIRM|nr:sugar ABC transporter permease [Vallitalea pronyensis]QUI24455.1 sugar ABC transporter permease [Vallitalea pronyensis]